MDLAVSLNDIHSSTQEEYAEIEEIYVDEHGMPTDRFLEALKSQAPTDALGIMIEDSNDDVEGDHFDLMKFDENGVRIGLEDALDDRINEGTSRNDMRHEMDARNNSWKSLSHDSQLSHKQNMKMKSKFRDSSTNTKESAKSTIRSQHTSKGKSKKSTSNGKGLSKQKKSIDKLNSPKYYSNRYGRYYDIESVFRAKKIDVDDADTADKIHPNFDENQIERDSIQQQETDYKLRTMMLRLRGLQQTIRVLEVRLQEKQDILSKKDDALVAALSRLKILENKESDRRIDKEVTSIDNTIRNKNIKSLENAIEILKEDKENLCNRLENSHEKEKRLQQRCRILKDYGEKSKKRITDLGNENMMLRDSLDSMEKQKNRFRKEIRNLSVEASTAVNQLDHQDFEFTQLSKKNEELESAYQEALCEMKNLRQENRQLKINLQSCEDRMRQNELNNIVTRDHYTAGLAKSKLRSSTNIKDKKDEVSKTAVSKGYRGEALQNSLEGPTHLWRRHTAGERSEYNWESNRWLRKDMNDSLKTIVKEHSYEDGVHENADGETNAENLERKIKRVYDRVATSTSQKNSRFGWIDSSGDSDSGSD